MLLIPAGARKYITWPVTGVPVDATVQARFNGGTWTAIERPTPDTVRVLVAGPEAPSDGTTVTAALTLGRNTYDVRVADSPEVDVESGLIYVTA